MTWRALLSACLSVMLIVTAGRTPPPPSLPLGVICGADTNHAPAPHQDRDCPACTACNAGTQAALLPQPPAMRPAGAAGMAPVPPAIHVASVPRPRTIPSARGPPLA